MLDKRLNKFKDYKEDVDVHDRLLLVENKLMSVLCTVNTDFIETETEADCLGKHLRLSSKSCLARDSVLSQPRPNTRLDTADPTSKFVCRKAAKNLLVHNNLV